MHAVMYIQGSGPSNKFLGKVLAKKSKILAGDLDLARRLRSCYILGKILARTLAGIILPPWARSWAGILSKNFLLVCACVCSIIRCNQESCACDVILGASSCVHGCKLITNIS